jgi:acetyl esterase/lipase
MGTTVKRSIAWILGVIAVLLLVLVAASPFLPEPLSAWHPRSKLAKKAHAQTAATSASVMNATPPPVATAVPSASPTLVPTAVPTAAPSPTPAPTASPSPTPSPVSTTIALKTMANGIRIGCEDGPPDEYRTCRAQEPGGFAMTFYLYLPKNYDAKKSYPLVLLLHGGGEVWQANKTAADNKKTLVEDPYAQVWGPGFPEPDSTDVQGKWPSFIVLPQVTAPNRFVDVAAGQGSYTLAPQPNDTLRLTKEIVDTVQLMYPNIDSKRRYVTGLSMGGYGAWEAAERWPNYWAAAAPIAGGGDPSKASRLVNLPIWAFHGSADTAVPPSGSRDMINAIRKAGGHPRYTEYAGQEHGVWEIPYTILGKPSPTPNFFAWLFAQHR